MTFRNDHLSYSRLTRFEQCPLSFKLHYIEKRDAEPGNALRFGKLIHAVLEQLMREVVDDERTGPLSSNRALVLFQDAWAAEGITGVSLFQDGVEILKAFVRDQGVVEHQSVLGIEREFRLPVGPFTVLGFIDRVDCIDDETVEVIDYKTNHQIFSREEVDTSLQMSLYHMAAQRLWPWAKKVRLTFHMLRHGIRMSTERTPEQLEAALAYVEALGRRTETATAFPPRLNANCCYCDHRRDCPAYAEALTGKRTEICDDTASLEAVAREREEVARLVKLLNARKDELEDVLKAHLKNTDELVLGGVKYRMFNATRVEYPLAQTVETIGHATALPWTQLIERLAVIDNKALDALVKELAGKLDKPRVTLLKAELEAHAKKTQSPRFWAKEVSK